MVPWKSSIGEISSKISSRPEVDGISPRLFASDATKRERHFSFPSHQSTLSTCSANRFGTSSGSRIFANEIRRGATELFFAAKRCPSRGICTELFFKLFETRTTRRSAPLYALTLEVLCERVGYRAQAELVQPTAYTPKWGKLSAPSPNIWISQP